MSDEEAAETSFGSELRRLRQAAGKSLARLAEELRTSKGYLSRLENGHQRPSVRFARACDTALDGHGALEALAAVTAPDLCPYPGLASFRAQDARWFFGRERAVAELLGLLADPRTAGRPAMVIGPSGIGKSSLLRAGLAAAVARGALPDGAERRPGQRAVLYMTPTARPSEELRVRSEECSPDSCGLLIVDQFEELFTLCPDEGERKRFVQELCSRAADGLPVAVGLRADFYGHCLAHPPLLAALQARALPLAPMGDQELRQAITDPAVAAGLRLEPGLVEVLLRDLGAGGSGACETGALPLLSHALRATWLQRVDSTLTVAGYERSGGVHGAVAATAERVHARLSIHQQEVARRLLLNLVHVGEGREDTRNRCARDELVGLTAAGVAGARTAEVTTVLEAFTGARLLTTDADHVEISHEALLSAWPRLREWIEGDRARLRLQQRFTDAARLWHEEGQDSSLLLRGARLATISEWLEDRAGVRPALRPLEQVFLRACRTFEESERSTERRRNRRLRQLVAGLAVLLVLALASGVFAVHKSLEAEQRTAESQTLERTTLAGLLSNEAVRLARSRPEVSAFLAATAYRLRHTPQSLGALLSTQAQGFEGRLSTPSHQEMLWSTALSDDSRVLASSDYLGRAVFWDVRRRKPIHVIDGLPEKLHAVAVSPDGSRVVGIGYGGTLRVWDTWSGRELGRAAVAPPGSPARGGLEFSRDGRTVAVAGAGVQLFLVDGLRKVGSLTSSAPVKGLALSPGGRTVAGAGWDGRVRIWQRNGPTEPVRELDTGAEHLSDVDFSEDGALLAAAGDDGVVRMWHTSDWSPSGVLAGHHGEVWDLAFRPDSLVLATAGEDQQVVLWDVRARRRLTSLRGHSAAVHSLAFSRDGLLASGGSDMGIALWDTTGWFGNGCPSSHEKPGAAAYAPGGPVLSEGATIVFRASTRCLTLRMPPGPVYGLAHGGPLLAAGGDAGAFRVWDLRNSTGGPYRLDPDDHPEEYRYQYAAAVAPNGNQVAVGGYSNKIRAWSMASSGRTRPLGTWQATGTVWALSFDPRRPTLAIGADHVVEIVPLTRRATPRRFASFSATVTALAHDSRGRLLAVGTDEGAVELWNIPTQRRLLTLSTFQGPVRALHFAPDGERIAVVGEYGAARWWTLDALQAQHRACRAASAPDPQEWQRLLPDVNRAKVLKAAACQSNGSPQTTDAR